MINLDCLRDICRIYYKYSDDNMVNSYRERLLKFKIVKRRKSTISILMKTDEGFKLKQMPILKPKLEILDNYNPDFPDVHNQIKKRLNKKNDKGILLLHGKPGTGKTTYLRYLINSIKKNIIFFPPNLASQIVQPDFVQFLISNPNTILVIEDAENIITNRENSGTSAVSSLLNISDGLLSDFLNIQVICSFNTEITNIDKALVRKGRLIANYEFKDLEIEKAKKLSERLGLEIQIDRPMSVSEIYNLKERDFNKPHEVKKIGF
ncbi:AAA family ATPase [Arthrospiribacter ruber]|uniref:AAA family ATPase n=2 Tax=Arthrospiribacter ruber TaxID=2487934 RepID=A0A951IVK0_9BACT|nr:AAA family ATPase [Arthrospiribacter ruber]